jgi:transcriptional regulator GlxA family with amidase domain
MRAVSLLIFDEVVPSSVLGVLDLLNGVNRQLERNGQAPAFAIELTGTRKVNFALASTVQLVSHKTCAEVPRPDLIIVPSFQVSDSSVLSRNQDIVLWLKAMRAAGAEVASLCAGSYFLAEAGLLHGKEVTSHWAVMDDMRQRYPDIKVKSDLVITDQDGVYTSGGAFSSLKLILYLIEKFCGRSMALWASKMYAIELDRSSQAHFAVFAGQRQHEDKEILEAQQYIEQHYQEELSMETVCAVVHMGKRNFIRRFKAATNNTPYEYLQRVRIESAKKAIEQNEQDLTSIIDDTGYKDFKTFRTVFKRITGLSPQEYRKKYARNNQTGVAIL